MGRQFSPPGQQSEAVENRHFEIGQHNLRFEVPQHSKGLCAIGSRLHGETLVAQQLDQSLACVGLVIDNQDSASLTLGHGHSVVQFEAAGVHQLAARRARIRLQGLPAGRQRLAPMGH